MLVKKNSMQDFIKKLKPNDPVLIYGDECKFVKIDGNGIWIEDGGEQYFIVDEDDKIQPIEKK